MPDDTNGWSPEDADGESTSHGSGIVRRTITPDPEVAEYEFLELIADLEGTRMEDLPSLYSQLDHLIELLYDTPPAAGAAVQIEFSYAGYRVTLDQQGHVTVVPVKDSAPHPDLD